MKILDKYIVRRFNVVLFFAIISFILITIVVDLTGNIDKFIDEKVPGPIVVKYYIYYIPYFLVLVFPVAMLLASLFSVGQMARYNELIAMKSVGISLYRILTPLLWFGLLITLFTFIFGEKVVPVVNHKKTMIEDEYIEGKRKYIQTRVTNIFWRDKMNRKIFIGYYDTRTKIAHKVSIQKYQGATILERIDAPEMRWQDSCWVLINGFHRQFADSQEIATRFEELKDSNIDILPEELAKSQKKPEDMSYEELKKFIEEVKRNGGDPDRWLVDLYLKISFPFANFIMVLFGAPLASNKKRSGPMVGFLISLFICFFYFGFVKFTQTLGHNDILPPLLSAWLSNGIFFLMGLFLIFFVRK